jgi:aspartyl-tRNA(Asn)/glutamyl-tRNA(Gln) amidotransferase subunit B
VVAVSLEGSLRADINISIRPVGSATFGTRTEVKNVNSFRSIERAVHSEVARQTQLITAGERVVQQTRQYDDATQSTRPLRDKEESHDYRYFPEPDLYPLVLKPELIQGIRETLPELPEAKAARYRDAGLSDFEIDVVLTEPTTSRYLDETIAAGAVPKEAAKWIVGELNSALKDLKLSFSESQLTPAGLAQLLGLIQSGKLSGKMAKEVLAECVRTGKSPDAVVAASGATQMSDTSELTAIIDRILDANLDVVEKVKGGKTNSADFLIGQVMKETRGRAKPDLVRPLILDCISRR